jgi:putative transposase
MNFNPLKVAFWAKHQQDWAESGLSLSAYCRREAIGYSTFYTWRKRLVSIAVDQSVTLATFAVKSPVASQVKHASVTTIASTSPRPAMKPCQLVPVSIRASLPEIVLCSPAGWQVTISRHVDLPALAQLLQQLP